ncbi:MAG TPA: hypothetical protein VKA50_07875 [Gammaproteobacteria bacterium]|nr:hypothetical protein [Gammaproteobacteria bacterium]
MGRRQLWTAIAVVVGSLSLSGCVGLADVGGHVSVRGDNTQVDVGFNEHQRDIIRRYYAQHRRAHEREYERERGHGHGRGRNGLPPGLAKRERLPPGLERQVERRGKLPPGLQTHPLPRDLERRLPALPENYVRVRVGTDIVLMNARTRVVIDMVKDVGQP